MVAAEELPFAKIGIFFCTALGFFGSQNLFEIGMTPINVLQDTKDVV